MTTYRKDRTEAQHDAYRQAAMKKRLRRRARNLRIWGHDGCNAGITIDASPSTIARNLKDFGITPNPLTKYTVAELYELAKNKGLKVTTKTRKPELLELLGVK